MSDEELEPREPLIDVRSPAERWSDAGRARYDALQSAVDRGRLDVAALVWMVLLLLVVVLEVYSGLRDTNFGSGNSDWWYKATIVAGSGGILVTFGGMIGVALAALARGRAARLALRLAMLGGAWAAVASVFGIATALHDPTSSGAFLAPPSRSGEAKVVSALTYVCLGGLGLVVAVVAWHVLRAHVDRSELDDGPFEGALPVS